MKKNIGLCIFKTGLTLSMLCMDTYAVPNPGGEGTSQLWRCEDHVAQASLQGDMSIDEAWDALGAKCNSLILDPYCRSVQVSTPRRWVEMQDGPPKKKGEKSSKYEVIHWDAHCKRTNMALQSG